MVNMPHPSKARYECIRLVRLANYYLELELLPPDYTVHPDFIEPLPEAIKVLWGAVQVDGEKTVRKALGVERFTKASSRLHNNAYSAVKGLGALVLRFVKVERPHDGPWKDTRKVPIKMLLKGSTGPHDKYKFENFRFQKVEDLWWGKRFKGMDFWNASGVHFRFQDDCNDHLPPQYTTGVAHMQFWTAGKPSTLLFYLVRLSIHS
jgi:hypothetical protein